MEHCTGVILTLQHAQMLTRTSVKTQFSYYLTKQLLEFMLKWKLFIMQTNNDFTLFPKTTHTRTYTHNLFPGPCPQSF